MLDSSANQRFGKGQLVFQEGDFGDYLLIILSGRVKVSLIGKEGKEFILALLGPGSFLGEMALLESAARSATVTTLESCDFLRLEQRHVTTLLQTHSSLGLKLLKALCTRLRETDERLRSLVMLDIYGRILYCLHTLVEPDTPQPLEKHLVISPRPSHQDIADMIGCSRETVSRAIKVLQNRGHITILKREILLHQAIVKP
ncbi:MAG: Crp/Fnr family transcriptional regulator [Nitrospirota bacterium]|nr:Crp/Fnr family transcriptional regulator [Nitrospirota bacterium]